MLLPIVGRKQLVELFSENVRGANISPYVQSPSTDKWNRGWLCMWAGLVIITKSFN